MGDSGDSKIYNFHAYRGYNIKYAHMCARYARSL